MIINHGLLLGLNKVLKHNEGSQQLLKRYVNYSFKLSLAGFMICALIDNDGLMVEPPHNTCYTVEINLPLSCAAYLINQDKLAAFRQIYLQGNREFGFELLQILVNLNMPSVTLSPALLFVITPFMQFIQALKDNLTLMRYNATTSISEYLLFETEDLVTRFELAEFCTAVDELTINVDRLMAQTKLLMARNS
ncbi:MAG: hypothetical protein KBD37_07580 [Burkholderiales bacterium]|nr:hypothetical protein [Burkholderiales bacterium]